MVMSNRPQEPPRATAGKGAAPRLEVRGTREQLSLNVVNTGFAEVMATLSQYTGVPIYVDDQVQQQVTASLRDSSLARILHTLASGYGLSLQRRDDAFYVSSGNADSAPASSDVTTLALPLHYLLPEDAPILLPDAALPSIHPDSDTQQVVINGAPPMVEKIAHDLSLLDTPAYNVRVRAWVISCQGTADTLREFSAAITSGTTLANGNSSGILQLQWAKGGANDLLLALDALAQQFDVRITSVPEIVVRNGHTANLFSGQDMYFWKLSGYPTQTLNLASMQVGSHLTIRPRTAGEWITTYIEMENNYLSASNTLGTVIILKESMNSTLRLHSGEAILFTGMQAQ